MADIKENFKKWLTAQGNKSGTITSTYMLISQMNLFLCLT